MAKITNFNEELAIMKTEISYMKTGIDKIDTKLETFINSADHKYATKEEVAELRKNNDWNKDRILELVYKLGVVAGLLYLATGGGL